MRVCDKFFLQHVFVFVVLQALLVNQLTPMSQQINNYLECRGPELRAEASGKESPLTGSGMCTQIYVVLVARMFIMITKCMCLCGGTSQNCTLGLKGLLLESMDLSLVLGFLLVGLQMRQLSNVLKQCHLILFALSLILSIDVV